MADFTFSFHFDAVNAFAIREVRVHSVVFHCFELNLKSPVKSVSNADIRTPHTPLEKSCREVLAYGSNLHFASNTVASRKADRQPTPGFFLLMSGGPTCSAPQTRPL